MLMQKRLNLSFLAPLPQIFGARFAPRPRFLLGIGFLAASLFTALPASLPHAKEPLPERKRTISVEVKPIPHFGSFSGGTRFGKLEYLGGLELKGKDPSFGGFSSLQVDAKGEAFIAMSDHAHWFTGKIISENEKPIAITDALIAPALNQNGRPLFRTRSYDTESIARYGNDIIVGVERTNEILRFNWGAQGVAARGVPMAVPNGIKKLPYNKGLEALGVLPAPSKFAGSIIGISERSDGAADFTRGFILGSKGGEFRYKRLDSFEITDLNFLPNGDMLVLERYFSWTGGLGMRIRRVASSTIQSGALLEGELLIDASLAHNIDNMEGLAVHKDATGRSILTIISDDNFSVIQKTILLRFALVE